MCLKYIHTISVCKQRQVKTKHDLLYSQLQSKKTNKKKQYVIAEMSTH